MNASIEMRGIESNHELSDHLEFLARAIREDAPAGESFCVNSARMFNDGPMIEADRMRMNLPPLRWVEMVVQQ